MKTFYTILALAGALAAQTAANPSTKAPNPAGAAVADEPRWGLGFNGSTLGLGLTAAVRLTESSNVRVGFNDFNFGHSFNNDGLVYTGHLDLRSVQANYDWFFAGSFHLSPGVLLYNNNHATATVYGPPGQQFTLGGTTYTSSSSNPVSGSGLLSLAKSGPVLTVGWGNLVPRHGSHFSLALEAGVAYQGSPNATLNLAGTACDSTGTFCAPVSSYPGISANVQQEQDKLNSKLHDFKVYPVATLGVGYSFGH